MPNAVGPTITLTRHHLRHIILKTFYVDGVSFRTALIIIAETVSGVIGEVGLLQVGPIAVGEDTKVHMWSPYITATDLLNDVVERWCPGCRWDIKENLIVVSEKERTHEYKRQDGKPG